MEFPFDGVLSELELAIQAAKESSKEIMKIYNKNEYTAEFKDDKEPLTEADLKSNEVIKGIIQKSGHHILSEEDVDDKNRINQNKVWIIDPIDGTNDFIDKNGEFTVMISLVENNEPILGVINWPCKNILYVAQKGRGAYVLENGKWRRIKVSEVNELKDCRLRHSRNHFTDYEQKFINNLEIKDHKARGSSLKAMDISSGNAEIYFTTANKIKQWDTCASYCILTEAGGKMTDMLGQPLKYNTAEIRHKNGILASNGLIHEELVKKFNLFSKN